MTIIGPPIGNGNSLLHRLNIAYTRASCSIAFMSFKRWWFYAAFKLTARVCSFSISFRFIYILHHKYRKHGENVRICSDNYVYMPLHRGFLRSLIFSRLFSQWIFSHFLRHNHLQWYIVWSFIYSKRVRGYSTFNFFFASRQTCFEGSANCLNERKNIRKFYTQIQLKMVLMRNFFLCETSIHMSILVFIWFPGSDMRTAKNGKFNGKYCNEMWFFYKPNSHNFFCYHLTVRTMVQEINVCATWCSPSTVPMHMILLTLGMYSNITIFFHPSNWKKFQSMADTSKIERLFSSLLSIYSNRKAFIRFAPFF